jgi:hypothetical protein
MKDIEKLFKDSLENHELPYDPSAWKSLESKLPQARIVKPINFTKWGLIGFAAAALAVSVFIVSNSDEKQTNLIDKKEVKYVEKQSTSTKKTTSTNPDLITEKQLINQKPVQKNSTENSTNSLVNIEQNQVRGEYENSNHQFMKDLENGVIPNNTNYQTTIVQSVPENQKSTSNFKIPVVSTKCQGETLELDNENSKSIVLKSPSGKLEVIRAKSQSKTILNQTGTYSISSVDEKGDLIELRTFNVINSPSVSLNFDSELTYENGLPVLKANLESEENKVKWTLNNKTLDVAGKNAVIYAFKKGAYELNVTATNEQGCKSSESKLIQVKDEYNLLAYNAFDPFSNDNRKTTFLPVALQNRTSPFEMVILDPTDGGIVFETSDASQPWDGIDKRDGKLVDIKKVYIWKVTIKFPEAGEKSEYKGTITRI